MRSFRSVRASDDQNRPGSRRRPLVEALEGRELLTIFSVTNVNDSGPGSLRQAIVSSNASSGTTVNTINFAIGNGKLATITPATSLPTITHPVVINGSSQLGKALGLGIVLNGAKTGSAGAGLVLRASNTTVEGLVIDGFAAEGVLVDGASSDTITDDYIGVTASGNVAAGNGTGVILQNGANSTIISNDVISGNKVFGVEMTGAGTTKNTVIGSDIGTNAGGTRALGNAQSGIIIEFGASSNTIGGTVFSAANTISGNGDRGVLMWHNADNNVIEGNFIGTNSTGTAPIGDGALTGDSSGVAMWYSSNGNIIGGSARGDANTIAANSRDGVNIQQSSDGNFVEGNNIGTNSASATGLGNRVYGVEIGTNSSANTISDGNTISANTLSGIYMESGTSNNVVQGNFIGTNTTGTAALGNLNAGVVLDGSSGNVIGGTTAGAANVISGNQQQGVLIVNSADQNAVAGNFIGTNLGGTAAIGNAWFGVALWWSSDANVIGGVGAAANTISANGGGVNIQQSSDGNTVQGNFIGTSRGGTAALGNAGAGVGIGYSSDNNTIGGTAAGTGNVISGNKQQGILIANSADQNTVAGNFIGTSLGGGAALGNSWAGVAIDVNSDQNTIGGVGSAGNTIAANLGYGINIENNSNGNTIEGDFIGTNRAGSSALANGNNGVMIGNGAANNIIGGTSAADGNIISNNRADGIELLGAGKGNLIEYNTIDSNGYGQPTGTPGVGVDIENSSFTSVINNAIDLNRNGAIRKTANSTNCTISGNT